MTRRLLGSREEINRFFLRLSTTVTDAGTSCTLPTRRHPQLNRNVAVLVNFGLVFPVFVARDAGQGRERGVPGSAPESDALELSIADRAAVVVDEGGDLAGVDESVFQRDGGEAAEEKRAERAGTGFRAGGGDGGWAGDEGCKGGLGGEREGKGAGGPVEPVEGEV